MDLQGFIQSIQKNIANVKIGIPYQYCFTFSPGQVDVDGFNNILQNPATSAVTAFFGGQITYSVIAPNESPIINVYCKNDGADESSAFIAKNEQTGISKDVLLTRLSFENLEGGTIALATVCGWIIPIQLP